MIRIFLVAICVLVFAPTFAQNGKVTLRNDSTFTGYLKIYTSPKDGHQGIEFWRTKKDKNPRKIPKSQISEYTINKQTYKIFHQYKPFASESGFFELVEAKVVSQGKVNLYQIADYSKQYSAAQIGGAIAVGVVSGLLTGGYTFVLLGSEQDLYVLDDNKGYMQAMPAERKLLNEGLKEFFPERYLIRYEQEKGKIKYGKLVALVKLYNSK